MRHKQMYDNLHLFFSIYGLGMDRHLIRMVTGRPMMILIIFDDPRISAY